MSKAYLAVLLISCAIAAMLGVTLNYLVDPYGLHRLVDRDGFNRKKPKSGTSGKLVKPYNVQSVRPKTLVLGNSRVEAGIDPESPQWPANARPVYNMSLPGSGIDAAVSSLRHVLSFAKPEIVVAGIDFFDFISDDRQSAAPARKPGRWTEFESRLLVGADGSSNDQYALQRVKDFASTLFSLHALADSVQTIALQGRGDQADLTERGFNPLREYQRFVRVDGHHALFRQAETAFLMRNLRGPKFLYRRGSHASDELDDLRRLIELCQASNVRLFLFIHPTHARMLEIYRWAGLWPLFEEWKRAVVRITDEQAAAHPGAAPVDLWDFSGFNEITAERVPTAGERDKPMQWYWEAGHYKREMGELMLARMLGDGSGPAPAAFGMKLDGRNIESHLTAIRDDRRHYADTHRDEIAALENLAQTVRTQVQARKVVR